MPIDLEPTQVASYLAGAFEAERKRTAETHALACYDSDSITAMLVRHRPNMERRHSGMLGISEASHSAIINETEMKDPESMRSETGKRRKSAQARVDGCSLNRNLTRCIRLVYLSCFSPLTQ